MIVATNPMTLALGRIADAIVPEMHVSSWEWICEHGRIPNGMPFDGERIPWCRGVCEAWDDPETRVISLPWGTRLGKTTISSQLIAKSAATSPMPGLFASSTESLTRRTVKNKLYKVLEHNPKTSHLIPAEHDRSTEEIRITHSTWGVAWSGSTTRLADLEAFYGVGNEVDKWSYSEQKSGDAGEGDALFQFFERFKEHLDHKIILECSPSTKSHSRIWKLLQNSNNCRYQVPCPKCGAYQVLRLGKEDEPGGIRFDRHPDGSSDPDLARKTARYVCSKCSHEIYNDQRSWMMQRGVWVPEGCRADKRGRVKGAPKRGPRHWGGQLSSLYSLQIRWGDVAEKLLTTKRDPPKFRMFVNGWLAEPWEPYKSKTAPEQLGDRITLTDEPRGRIPKWCTWLFAGVDRQVDHYVYWVVAVDAEEREHLVDHGTCDSEDEIEARVIRKRFEHADGGEPLWPAETFIDCGYRTRDIYLFCKRFKGTSHRVTPCKGANTDCAGEAYEKKIIGVNEGKTIRTKKALIRAGLGLTRVRVNPYYYEPITQEQIDDKNPGEPGCLTLHAECADDLDLLQQICNGAEAEEPSKIDPNRCLWVKPRQDDPNDYRDAKKYARCAMDFHFKHKWSKAKKRQVIGKQVLQQQKPRPTEEPMPARRERFKPDLGARRR